MIVELLSPVALAIEEMKIGTTKQSISYNYYQHCLNVALNDVE